MNEMYEIRHNVWLDDFLANEISELTNCEVNTDELDYLLNFNTKLRKYD